MIIVSGELRIKVQDELEPELKKFLEAVFLKTGETTIDNISFEEAKEGGFYNVYGNKANKRIYNIDHLKYKDHSLCYCINIYYPEDIGSADLSEERRKELFFVVSFTKDEDRYEIVVNSADSKHFANHEVTVYMKYNDTTTKVAHYILSALTEREEFKFIDNLMDRARNIAKYFVSHQDKVSDDKLKFLSIISDIVNIGNEK